MTTVQQLSIQDGDAGVLQTVAQMTRLIRQGVATPIVRDAATQIAVGAGQSGFDQAYAIRDFLAARVQFVRDPTGVELLHTPEWLLRRIGQMGVAGVDCDDVAILGGALAGAVGLRVRLVVVAFLDNSRPQLYGYTTAAPFSHVWASVSPAEAPRDANGEIWIDLDTTRPMQNIPMHMIARSQVFRVLG